MVFRDAVNAVNTVALPVRCGSLARWFTFRVDATRIASTQQQHIL
ncbi:hypothetical protein QWZ16_17175 [Vibrio ostreicida]|uniref:Uncharacterized protein n=1 Tax=Vibrio ostreicida TaxID=526588 RepID=A0ABT8BZ20_9VIBR|nr:hypothetical protein [Vibrio ostreicida]MDN3611335.1 hypothetical protein [Vibrio ostreicida]